MRQLFGQQFARAGQAELGEDLHCFVRRSAGLDLADDPVGNSQSFQRDGGPDPDFRIGVIQREHQRPLGNRADLLQCFDAAHPDPPGRVAQCAHQRVDHLGVVELPQGAGDPGPDERRRIGEQVIKEIGDRAVVSQFAERFVPDTWVTLFAFGGRC